MLKNIMIEWFFCNVGFVLFLLLIFLVWLVFVNKSMNIVVNCVLICILFFLCMCFNVIKLFELIILFLVLFC